VDASGKDFSATIQLSEVEDIRDAHDAQRLNSEVQSLNREIDELLDRIITNLKEDQAKLLHHLQRSLTELLGRDYVEKENQNHAEMIQLLIGEIRALLQQTIESAAQDAQFRKDIRPFLETLFEAARSKVGMSPISLSGTTLIGFLNEFKIFGQKLIAVVQT
jgi:ElaB/YqjD/DUF883 family membrane-anchored ribosome-binding protein